MDTLQYANECDFDGTYSPTHSSGMDKDIERGFGDRLDELMRADVRFGERGQSALARASGVPQATISRTLKKASAPEMETVVQFAKVFNVTCEWLLTERGPKYVKDMPNDVMVNPDANVTGYPTNQEISTLIIRLQGLHDQVLDLLTFVKGLPSISPDYKNSDHMHNPSARARVAAAAEDIRKNRSEGEKHGKHQNGSEGRKAR